MNDSITFSAGRGGIKVQLQRIARHPFIFFTALTQRIQHLRCEYRVSGIFHFTIRFPYNAGACGYRILSEDEIEVLYMETKKLERNFPYENYPSEFPERKVRLLPISYEHHKTLVFYLQADKDALSDDDRQLILDEYHYPFTQIGGIHKMWQDIPRIRCPDPSCANHKFECFMEVFAVIWNQPVKGVFLWEIPEKARFSWQKD